MLQPTLVLPILAHAPVLVAAIPVFAWVGIVVAAVLIALVTVRVMGRGSQIESTPERSALPNRAAPSNDALAREEVTAPVEIREGMSLKEIKAAKHARLSEGFHGSDAALAEKQARKGSGVRAATQPVPTTEEMAKSAVSSPVAPAKESTPATPQPGPVLDGWDEIDLSDGAGPSVVETSVPDEATAVPEPNPEPTPERGLADGLKKTKGGFVARIGRIFSGKKTLDDATIEELEEVLFTADIGVRTSQRLLQAVQERFADGEIELDQVWDVLRAETSTILDSAAGELKVGVSEGPFVLLMVGVNGAGKTTTIGKLASHYTSAGKSVLMVAGDTFRAAAVNQLVEWADRVGCDIHVGQDEGDPSGVIFDGIKKGVESNVDVILCDTAGRLQTKKPLMDELGKIVRVSGKALPGAPHETVLVIDANTGQNAIQQAQLFRAAAPLTGLILTKLDGTAKGGVVIGISEEMQLPIYHIGIGEAVTDLRRFAPDEFVDALF